VVEVAMHGAQHVEVALNAAGLGAGDHHAAAEALHDAETGLPHGD